MYLYICVLLIAANVLVIDDENAVPDICTSNDETGDEACNKHCNTKCGSDFGFCNEASEDKKVYCYCQFN